MVVLAVICVLYALFLSRVPGCVSDAYDAVMNRTIKARRQAVVQNLMMIDNAKAQYVESSQTAAVTNAASAAVPQPMADTTGR